MKDKAVVLLSSGLDSTVNLYKAYKDLEVTCALNYNYGQRAAKKERESAREICSTLGIPLMEMDLPFFSKFLGNSLTNKEKAMSQNMDIHNLEECLETAKNVWVPNRNGVFLNIAAAIAEDQGAKYVIPGFNKEEAATFPDNSKDYRDALDHAFSFSTQNKVKVFCYTFDFNKKEIYQMGKDLGVDFTKIWYCYESGDTPCGQCESCLRFENAKKEME